MQALVVALLLFAGLQPYQNDIPLRFYNYSLGQRPEIEKVLGPTITGYADLPICPITLGKNVEKVHVFLSESSSKARISVFGNGSEILADRIFDGDEFYIYVNDNLGCDSESCLVTSNEGGKVLCLVNDFGRRVER